MSWAKFYIDRLQFGETFTFRAPNGTSMMPLIYPKDNVTVSPDIANLKKGDMVLCQVKGQQYLHLIQEVKIEGEAKTYLIGNNKGGVNGWTSDVGIFGKVIKVNENLVP